MSDTKGLYKKWHESDIASMLASLAQAGKLRCDLKDGKYRGSASYETTLPWYYPTNQLFDCPRYHEIMFSTIGIMPSHCLQCWKVVVAPRSLRELWQIKELQDRLKRPSKCGIELREYVPRLYGAYFYNGSLEAGLDCYRLIRKEVDALIGPEVGVILKRGCTEFERGLGPSNLWDSLVTPETMKIEKELKKWLVTDKPKGSPDHIKRRTFRLWIEHAYSHGDPTWVDFMDESTHFPLYVPIVTYHNQSASAPDQRGQPGGGASSPPPFTRLPAPPPKKRSSKNGRTRKTVV